MTVTPGGSRTHHSAIGRLRAQLGHIVAGKRVLELGCGEGHLTSTLFGPAASVLGIDISDVAIARAKARGIRNARFKVSDLLAIRSRAMT